jgi:hypothetical protein
MKPVSAIIALILLILILVVGVACCEARGSVMA